MPLPTDYPTAADELKRLIIESERPLLPLSKVCGVSYESLWKWVTGRQKSFSLLEGERVYYELTGRTFLTCGGTPTRDADL